MSQSYKRDVKRSTNCTCPDYTLKLMIYYKNLKTSLLLKNNDENPDLENTNIIYTNLVVLKFNV